MSLRHVLLCTLLGVAALPAHATGPSATDWITPAEAAHFRSTPSYADTLAYLQRLQQAVIANDNVFEVLMDAVRVCSLGQITSALFAVGGQYRRNM